MFDYAVNEALNNAVAKREKNMVFKMMKGGVFNDSFIQQLEVFLDTNENNTIRQKQENSQVGIDSGKRVTINLLKAETREWRVEGDSFSATKWRRGRVDSILLDIVSSINIDSINGIIAASDTELDSLIRASLLQQGIESDFEFMVKAFGDKPAYKTEGYELSLSSGEYAVSLNPAAIEVGGVKLHVQIKNREGHVLKLLLPFVVAMLVFSIIISATFIISIRTILKQKKLNIIKNDFINNMTHEFKTPIATISLASDTLKNEKPTLEQINHFADIIKQESKSMNQKVETILQMALVEQQEIKLNKERVGVNLLVENATQHHKLKLENLGGEMSSRFLEPDYVVNVDKHHMGNVISNIIDNAIKYARGTPQVDIKVLQLKDNIVIDVADKGIGMSKDEQKRVFDKFYRAESGNIHNTKGFGLGLSYASEIIKLHNGQIHIESEKGVGTTVSLTLPIENED